MMRTTELLQLAEKFQMTVITIADLVRYRMDRDSLVHQEAHAKMPTKYGEFEIYGYVNKLNGEHHVALTMGTVFDGEPVLCRVHSECLTGVFLAGIWIGTRSSMVIPYPDNPLIFLGLFVKSRSFLAPKS